MTMAAWGSKHCALRLVLACAAMPASKTALLFTRELQF